MSSSIFSTNKHKTSKRAIALLLFFSVTMLYLISNIFVLSVFKYDYYKDKAYDQITTTSALIAKRGNIYDANMNILASSSTTWRIFASPRDIAKKSKAEGVNYAELISKKLSECLSLNYDTILKRLKNTSTLDATIKKAATEEEYTQVRNFINEMGIDDILFTEAQHGRYYPSETLAAHILGFTGSDGQGLYGLEYSYNKILSGNNGYYMYAKDAGGNPLPGEYATLVPAVDGNSIITTIDSFIQSSLESELENIRVNHDVQNRVTGIVMNTETGAILAMATSSPFNPNSPYILDEVSQKKLDLSGYVKGSDEYNKLKQELMQIMWSNKAVSETYEPGSTFKIVTVSSALDLGVAKTTDTFSCHGYHEVGGWRIKCHKVTGHGSGFSLSYGLQMSCNPTMMALAERIGADNFYSYVEKFGYFEKTGIDLPSEARTIFHQKENIGSTELATASFGQRFKVSVISQLCAVAAIANGGKLVQPYLVDKVIDSNGNIIKEHQTVVKRQVVSESVASVVSEILEQGVSGEGGAKNAYVEGYKIAAKTGTSQKFDVLDANGNSYLRIGSTVAYAPSDMKGIAVIIVVDEPQSSVKYGSVVAAPYISSLMSKILPYLEYESSSEKTTVTVGNYVGMNINSVKTKLKNEGIKFNIVGDGNVVVAQMPQSNIEITKELSTVTIYTVKEDIETVTMPNLIGKSVSEANIILINSGLNIKINGVSDYIGKNLTVTYQSVSAGAKLSRGEVIEITVMGLDFYD